jgi:hypothetical protein
MSKADKIKAIIKGPAPKETFGTNPSDPWSTKANIAEFAGTPPGLLSKYLKSRGINPNFATKDQKIAHSKTGQFQKWQRDHVDRASLTGTNIKVESVDKKDTVTFDIPLLIRVLELAREDIKSDMDLHRVVERLINMRDQGMLTMDDYDTIANIKENHIAIAMGKMLDDEGSMVLDQLEQLERAIGMIRSYVGKDYTKQLPAWVQSKVTLATDYVDTVGNYLSSKNEESFEIDGVVLETYYGPRGDKLIAHSHALHKAGDKENSKRAHTIAMKAGERYRSNPVNRDKAISHIMSGANKDYTSGKTRTNDSVEYSDNNVISENIKPGDFVKDIAYGQGHTYRVHKVEGNNLVVNRHHGKDSYGTFTNLHKTKARKVETPTNEEVVSEVSDATLTSYKEKAKKSADTLHAQGQYKKSSNRWLNVMKATGKQIDKMQKEDTYQDSYAATQTPFDTGNNPADITPPQYKGKRLIQMSKSARIIKNIYKKKGMKEETYDFEKADKSVASYGQPPKVAVLDKKKIRDDKDQAAMVLTGGKTLTGTERDTVEIDPAMKMRPNQPEPVKKLNKSQS